MKMQRLPTRVVLLSSSINNAQALEAVRLGADGLLLKEAAAIAHGRPNKPVARDLRISEGTVKMHLHRIYEKLNVKNGTELSAVARDQGLI